MNKQFKASSKLTAKFLVVLMVLQAALFSFTAFGATPTALEVKLAGKSISAPVLMYTGAKLTFAGIFTPTDATYHVTWGQTGGAVTVDSATGIVTAGTTGGGAVSTLTASANKGTFTVAPVTIVVYKQLTTALFILPTTAKVNVSQTVYIPASHGTADVTSTVYSFTTGTTSNIITLDTVTGAVYAKASGTVSVKVTKTLPLGLPLVKTISIVVPEPVTALAISSDGKVAAGTTLGIDVGKSTTLKAILTPFTAKKVPTDIKVNWTSSNPSIVIDSKTGTINLLKSADTLLGTTALITATADDTSYSAVDTITVTVVKELKTATVKSVLLLKAGHTKTIIPVLKSANTIAPDVTSVTYTAEAGKTGTLTVDSATGVVYGKVSSPTPVKITVVITATDGSVKTLYVTATVVADVTNIVLTSPTTALKPMKLYSKATVKSVITPLALKMNAVRFVSANPAIAFVNPFTGEVTATGVGSTTITANADGFTSSPITIDVADTDGLLIP